MGALVAGEGGCVLAAAALAEDRPRALACEGLAAPARTDDGVPVYPLTALSGDGGPTDVDRVELVGGEAASRDRARAWAEARGLPVRERSVGILDAPRGLKVVAVSSASTGSGKTALVRRLARLLRRSGVAVAVARHPFPNLLLWDGRRRTVVVRSPAELTQPRPIEEWEELAPVVGLGVPVATGIDPEQILRAAARAAGPGGVVLWDGGGSASPWVRPDVHFVVVDLLRPPAEGTEERVRAADVVVLSKADTAPPDRALESERVVRSWNPKAAVLLVDMPPAVPEGARLTRRRVVVVEDAPSLMLGGLKAGSGAVVARRFRCGVVDPRPFAVGAVADALRDHPHIGPVIPSVGRTPAERGDLAASVRATPGDAILWSSPADPAHVLGDVETRPVFRTYADVMEVAGRALHEILEPVLGSGPG